MQHTWPHTITYLRSDCILEGYNLKREREREGEEKKREKKE